MSELGHSTDCIVIAFVNRNNNLLLLLMALQPFVVPWQLFQFPYPIKY
jgi:hypothetical protein